MAVKGDYRPVAFDRLLLAFSNLESYGIEARITRGSDPALELERLKNSIRERYPAGSASCIFTTFAGIECFDSTGELRSPLAVHHSGPDVARAAKAAFGEFGLGVVEDSHPSTLQVIDLEAGEPEASPALSGSSALEE